MKNKGLGIFKIHFERAKRLIEILGLQKAPQPIYMFDDFKT